VLAEVHRLHGTAASSAVGGLPGVLPAEIATYSVGFVGEELVGQQLACLPAGWRVLHAVPVGDRGSDIDHVVIGRAGVFVINTKHHRGATVDVKGDAVFLGGNWQPYIRNSRLEAGRALGVVAGSGIPAPVTAVLCVVGGRVRVKETPDDVVALEAPDLVRWLTARPRVLTPEQVDQLYGQLRWADAWTASEPPAQAPAWVAELARQLATEHGMASTTRRQNSRARRTSATPATGPARWPASRNPARSRPSGRRPKSGSSTRTTLLKLGLIGVLLLTAGAWSKPVGAALVKMATPQALTSPAAPAASSAPVAPVGPLAYVATLCKTGSGPAHDLGGNALACLPAPDGSGHTTWQFADPVLRLPIALPGAPCTKVGAHGWNSLTKTIQVCATYPSYPQKRWRPDPTWKPS
jgi:hypothetical protein